MAGVGTYGCCDISAGWLRGYRAVTVEGLGLKGRIRSCQKRGVWAVGLDVSVSLAKSFSMDDESVKRGQFHVVNNV